MITKPRHKKGVKVFLYVVSWGRGVVRREGRLIYEAYGGEEVSFGERCEKHADESRIRGVQC